MNGIKFLPNTEVENSYQQELEKLKLKLESNTVNVILNAKGKVFSDRDFVLSALDYLMIKKVSEFFLTTCVNKITQNIPDELLNDEVIRRKIITGVKNFGKEIYSDYENYLTKELVLSTMNLRGVTTSFELIPENIWEDEEIARVAIEINCRNMIYLKHEKYLTEDFILSVNFEDSNQQNFDFEAWNGKLGLEAILILLERYSKASETQKNSVIMNLGGPNMYGERNIERWGFANSLMDKNDDFKKLVNESYADLENYKEVSERINYLGMAWEALFVKIDEKLMLMDVESLENQQNQYVKNEKRNFNKF